MIFLKRWLVVALPCWILGIIFMLIFGWDYVTMAIPLEKSFFNTVILDNAFFSLSWGLMFAVVNWIADKWRAHRAQKEK